MIGVSHHLVGDQTKARRHIERALADNIPPVRQSYVGRFLVDPRLMGRVSLARIQWLQGFPDMAMRTAEISTDDAEASSRAVSLCYVLAVAACPIALWNGDLVMAEHYIEKLLDHSVRHTLPFWRAVGHRHQGVLFIKRDDLDGGLQLLDAGGAKTIFRSSLFFLGEMAVALGRAGKIADALAAVAEAIDRSESTKERWIMPELLRIQGELILLQSTPGGAETAGDLFRQALDGACRQEALSWELRAAMSLARLLRHRRRPADAIACLQPIYDRFTEGFGTADLIAAKQLLDELSDAGRREVCCWHDADIHERPSLSIS